MEGFDKAKYEADLAAADQYETKKAEIQAGNSFNSFDEIEVISFWLIGDSLLDSAGNKMNSFYFVDVTVGIQLSDMSGNWMVISSPVTELSVNWMVW